MDKEKIEQKVINQITPNKDIRKKIDNVVIELEKKIQSEIKNKNIKAQLELVGSIAKDTYLINNMDFDFFLVFPKDISKEEISKNALDIGKKILKNTEESYAEHPYIRGYYKDFKIEIVPCYKIEKACQKISAVDRTPLHTEFIKKNLKEDQKKEVRLFKQFLKGINCYGAEAEIQGFSGYLCEIILLKYKDFNGILKNAYKWQKGIKISLKPGNYQDFDSPLIFIDPVDSSRNVASAVSDKKFDLFVKACNEYIDKPRITFFYPNHVEPWKLEKIKEKIKKKDEYFFGIKIPKPEILSENLYPQIRKAARSIKESCEREDFEINNIKYHVKNGNIFFIIIVKNMILPDVKTHKGPPSKLKNNVDNFVSKYKNNSNVVRKPYEKDKRFYVDLKREYIDIKIFLEENIKDLSLGKSINKKVEKKYEILELDELIIEDLRIFWTEYLDDKYSWER